MKDVVKDFDKNLAEFEKLFSEWREYDLIVLVQWIRAALDIIHGAVFFFSAGNERIDAEQPVIIAANQQIACLPKSLRRMGVGRRSPSMMPMWWRFMRIVASCFFSVRSTLATILRNRIQRLPMLSHLLS